MQVNVLPTPSDLAVAVADHVEERIGASDGPFALGLAGGRTPQAAYAELTRRPVDWERVMLWLGDERWVPETHPDSNAAMARRTLADAVGARFLVLDHGLGDPDRAADEYARVLAETLRMRYGFPSSEVIVLGLGEDGHTASLFPGTAALAERDRSYVANWVPAKEAWRLTATLPLLWSAAELVFVVAGTAKANVAARIIDDGEPFPARVAANGPAPVSWFLDEAAASGLRKIRR